MALKTKVITPPTLYPVTVDEVRSQLRLGDDSPFDAEIERYIKTSTNWALRYTGRHFLDTVLEGYTNVLNGNPIEITDGPVKEITSIEYWEYGATDYQELNTDLYALENTGLTATIHFLDAFSAITLANKWDAVKITFTAGYGDATKVPEEIKDALIMKAARLFTHPDDGVNERNTISDTLLNPFQVPRV